MRAFGTIYGKTVELNEVMLMGDSDELMELIPFIRISAERNAYYSEPGESCHTHLSEWDKEWRKGDLEITIYSNITENEERKGEE